MLKVMKMRIRGTMLSWMKKKKLFPNRTARVSMDGSTSNLIKLRERVPQGGVISPTLFLIYIYIYINDLTSVFPNFVSNTLHADDLAVWSCEENVSTATHRLQEKDWADKWAMTLNRSETVATFSHSQIREELPAFSWMERK